jgi:hypothetical protein
MHYIQTIGFSHLLFQRISSVWWTSYIFTLQGVGTSLFNVFVKLLNKEMWYLVLHKVMCKLEKGYGSKEG